MIAATAAGAASVPTKRWHEQEKLNDQLLGAEPVFRVAWRVQD